MSKSKIDRRKFIAALSAGTAHLLFTPLFVSANKSKLNFDPLQTVKLGKSGIETTLLGMGTGVNGYNNSSFLTRQDHKKSINTLIHAYEKGIQFFDLADGYGTHFLMKEALKSMDRDKVTLTSKMWTRDGGDNQPGADVIVDRFRKELDVDFIDLVQLHCLVDANWTDNEKRQMDLLENLKTKGIIRAHGTSVHSLEAMKAAAKDDWVDVLHARINPYGVAMDRKDPQEVIDVLTLIHQAGKGVIGMKMIGNGNFKNSSDKINETLKFVLGLGILDMLIVGFENKNEIDDYINRLEKTLKMINN